MSNLRGETKSAEMEIYEEYDDDDESMRGVNDPDYDMWEEWMGWEGAGIRDYSSHINPYI
uniref:DnaJ protein n=2 Tax=Solanum TaxID=4107 RepID=M1CRS6_SOLTU